MKRWFEYLFFASAWGLILYLVLTLAMIGWVLWAIFG